MTHLQNPQDEEARVERLNFLIEEHFGRNGPDHWLVVARDYDYETMVMIEIKHVLSEGLVVEDFDEKLYAPVIVPPDIRAMIAPGDVFLVTLALRENAWHVIYMSPWHEPMYVDEEDEEVWDGQTH